MGIHTIQFDENFLRVGYFNPSGQFITIEAFDRNDEEDTARAYKLVNYLNGGGQHED